jgi:hypothetical protein
VKYFLGLKVVITKAVNKASNKKAGLTELLFESSEFNGILYHVFSLSLVYLLSKESEEEKSSD